MGLLSSMFSPPVTKTGVQTLTNKTLDAPKVVNGLLVETGSVVAPQFSGSAAGLTGFKTINGMPILGAGDLTITTPPEEVPALNPLLVYYGYPIAYKGLWDAGAVIAEISANFKYWVVGHTYQSPTHEEYLSTQAIIQGVRAAGVKVYGYIPLGTTSYNYTVPQIAGFTDEWAALGVDGIFLDEYGFDYGNTRQRQVDVVSMIHSKGLPICANAWVMEEFVCDTLAETGWPAGDWKYDRWLTSNPTDIPSPHQPGDSYLIENFCYSNTGPAAVWDVQERALLASQRAAAKNISLWGLAVFGETTPGTLDTSKLGNLGTLNHAGEYISANAYLYDIAIVGSGGFSFGSGGFPLWAPLRQLPASAQPAAALAENNYTDKTGTRYFGPVRLSVLNTDTTQAVFLEDVTPAVIGNTDTNGDLDVDGNINLTGTARRIIGDFSNAQVGNRLLFQTSVANGVTGVYAIPNGTAQIAAFAVTNSSDPGNASAGSITQFSTDFRIASSAAGTGAYLPMTLYTGGSERLRIDAGGNVGVGTSTPSVKMQVRSPTACQLYVTEDSTGITAQMSASVNGAIYGSLTNDPVQIRTNNVERLRIDTVGNVSVQSGTLVCGNGQTAAYPPAAITVNPTTHATSKRAAISLGAWIIGQDYGGNGLRDFFLYDSAVGQLRFSIDTDGNAAFKAGVQEAVVVANTGSAYTINLGSGTIFDLTLTANCVYTFPTPTAGKQFTILQKQDATGSRTSTWPTNVRWDDGGTAPTPTATAGRTDVFTFLADGTYWIGFKGPKNYNRG